MKTTSKMIFGASLAGLIAMGLIATPASAQRYSSHRRVTGHPTYQPTWHPRMAGHWDSQDRFWPDGRTDGYYDRHGTFYRVDNSRSSSSRRYYRNRTNQNSRDWNNRDWDNRDRDDRRWDNRRWDDRDDRHDNGLHRGWTKGKHKGWNKHDRR